MPSITAEPITKHPNEILLMSVDATLFGLRSGESLTGTPVVTCSSSDITIDNETVNLSTFTNRRGKTVAVGKGIQFTVAGGVAGTNYVIIVSCGTNGSPAQTLVGRCPLEVKDSD